MLRIFAGIVLGLAAAFVLLVVLVVGDAWGHEAPAGWAYDAACCSSRDCAPVSGDEVTERDGGFFLKSRGEFIPWKDTRQGKDDRYHLCVDEMTNARLCFYRKFNGA